MRNLSHETVSLLEFDEASPDERMDILGKLISTPGALEEVFRKSLEHDAVCRYFREKIERRLEK